MIPVRYQVGDSVIITKENIKTMINSNRSCVTPQYPTSEFIDKAIQLVGVDCVGAIGVVTHTFPPGYEVTAKFGDQNFHMKDNWITQFSASDIRSDIKAKLIAEEAKDLSDEELRRVFGDVSLSFFCIKEAQKARSAGITMDDIVLDVIRGN